MNTDIKAVQIIISLLKQNDIRHFVISPGTRHVPLVHCVEMDPFFKCYSVVDERSAGYFALGLSEALDKPVCVTCTSSTASCNYMPAMQEAYERGVQLIALTSDKARYRMYHGISQCIDQVDMYKPYRSYAVDVPVVNNSDDYWYCNRCVNEALLEVNHHRKGPVQINFLEPVNIATLAKFNEKELPVTRKIDRNISPNWEIISKKLCSKKKILVLCGQYYCDNVQLSKAISKFYNRYNVVVTYDSFSNVRGEDFILSPLIGQTFNLEEANKLRPDLIITYGSKVYSDLMGTYYGEKIEHWDINDEGRVFDSTKNLTTIFECKPYDFFSNLTNKGDGNDKQYLALWKQIAATRHNNIDKYSNYYVAKHVIDAAPNDTIIHASVLNSMKFTNYCELKDGIDAFGNINADGIDGALSTFLGQANTTDRTCLLVIGDLSFLYDLNASGYILKPNIRILLINNHAGGEFHYNIGKRKISTIDWHIAASHNTDIKNTPAICNLTYLTASNEEELNERIKDFFKPSEKPVLLEVFTDANDDGETLRAFLASNHIRTKKEKISLFARKMMGQKLFSLIKTKLRGSEVN